MDLLLAPKAATKAWEKTTTMMETMNEDEDEESRMYLDLFLSFWMLSPITKEEKATILISLLLLSIPSSSLLMKKTKKKKEKKRRDGFGG